jgi:hypothetical protein
VRDLPDFGFGLLGIDIQTGSGLIKWRVMERLQSVLLNPERDGQAK